MHERACDFPWLFFRVERGEHSDEQKNEFMTVSDSWSWLIREGHEILRQVSLLSQTPLRIDWRNSRLLEWQRAMLEEQVRFRLRSRDRFPDEENWLWTDRSLQQASDWLSATYKANLFAADLPVMDACCGAGADLVALAQHHRVVGVDRDPRMTSLARANLRAHRLEGDVCVADVPRSLGNLSRAALHIDPDRRSGDERSTRTTHGEAFSPSLAESMELAARARAAIIKLAPATELQSEALADDWRRAWLGSPRACPQQLLLRGDTLLQIPANHVAAILCRPEAAAQVYSGVATTACDIVDEPSEFLYEPHPPLYAAHLAATWAAEHGAMALSNPRGYFTGAEQLTSPWAQTFRVLDFFAWDDRRVRKWLRANDAGTLEVKSRLVVVDAGQLQRRYSQPEGRPLVCLLTRIGKGTRAIMAERTTA